MSEKSLILRMSGVQFRDDRSSMLGMRRVQFRDDRSSMLGMREAQFRDEPIPMIGKRGAKFMTDRSSTLCWGGMCSSSMLGMIVAKWKHTWQPSQSLGFEARHSCKYSSLSTKSRAENKRGDNSINLEITLYSNP